MPFEMCARWMEATEFRVEPASCGLRTAVTMQMKTYRGIQRCSRIDYADAESAFAVTLCVKPRRRAFVTSPLNGYLVGEMKRLQDEGLWGVLLYCIMPDHVHLVVNPGPAGLSEAVRRFKGRTATWWRESGDGTHLWQDGYFDHRIRGAKGFEEKCQYVLQNPVRSGLVARPEEHPWSGSLAAR